MESDTILSFSAPGAESRRVEAFASPVLELVYAAFFLATLERRQQLGELDWLEAVKQGHPKLLRSLASFWPDADQASPALEIFILACKAGYARDQDPRRFIVDLPSLPAHIETMLAVPESTSFKATTAAALERRFDELGRPLTARRYQRLLTGLWRALGPIWSETGRDAVEAERGRFLAALERGDLFSALPRHYFARSESFMHKAVEFLKTGRVLVSPLYFAAGGGFNLDFDGELYLGYALKTESVYRQLAARSDRVAHQLKAFADPTRLLVLSMIGRFDVTVGDLAAQLEVSQPTVSGHLKVLREANLVRLERQGNKAFYKVNKEAVHEALAAAEALMRFT